HDPELQPFNAEIVKLFAEYLPEVEAELGFSLQELADFPAGEMAFAAVMPAGRRLSLVAIVDVRERGDTLERLLETLDKALKDQQSEGQVEQFEGTDITAYALPEDAGIFNTFAYVVRDGRLVLTLSADTGIMEDILVRWDGTNDRTFAGSSVYSYILDACEVGRDGRPLMAWYVSPIDLVRAVMSSNEDLAMQSMTVMTFLPLLGLDRFKGMGGTMDMATEEFDSVTKTFLYVEQPASGVLKVFEFPAIAQGPPRWVSADVAQYSAVNWNLQAAYTAVETLYDLFTGQAGGFGRLVDQIAQQPGGLMIHPKEDLIDQFTGLMHFVTDLPPEGGLEEQRMLFALQLKDEARMREVINTIKATNGVNLTERDFQGTTIYEAEQAGAGGMDPAAAITRGYLLFATHARMLEDVIRRDEAENPLADSEDYQRIAAHMPEKLSILGYQKPDAQVRAVYEMVRSGQLDAVTEGRIDFSKLPEFDVIRKYLPTTGSYAVPDERGALFVNFSLPNEN
ncbi:MAG: DUF3352 domain-containing protein, partial [Maioricimonas sp. JB049]